MVLDVRLISDWDEPRKPKSIAHLMEHLVFRGGRVMTLTKSPRLPPVKEGISTDSLPLTPPVYNYVVPKEHFEDAFVKFLTVRSNSKPTSRKPR